MTTIATMTDHLEEPCACTPGDVVDGRYAVEELVAVGGMGAVFRAKHLLLDRPVALKVLSSALANNAEIVARLLHEARAATLLENGHAVEIFDVGTTARGAPYIAMEWLEGSDLATIVAGDELPVTTVVDYVLQACEALAEVHARGIVHRDVKPSNLFVTRGADNRALVKLIDFGVSKIDVGGSNGRAAGGIVGTPWYMAPEQMSESDRQTDHRADVWALGVVLFELLTRRMPFAGENLVEILSSIVLKERVRASDLRADIPRALDRVITKCLTVDVALRFQSVTELAEALAPFGPPSAAARVETVVRLANAAKSKPIEVRVTPSDERWIKAAATPSAPAEPSTPREVPAAVPPPARPRRLELVFASTAHHAPIAVGRSRRKSTAPRRVLAATCALAVFWVGIPSNFQHLVHTVDASTHAALAALRAP